MQLTNLTSIFHIQRVAVFSKFLKLFISNGSTIFDNIFEFPKEILHIIGLKNIIENVLILILLKFTYLLGIILYKNKIRFTIFNSNH